MIPTFDQIERAREACSQGSMAAIYDATAPGPRRLCQDKADIDPQAHDLLVENHGYGQSGEKYSGPITRYWLIRLESSEETVYVAAFPRQRGQRAVRPVL